MAQNVAMCRCRYSCRQICTVTLYADELYCLTCGLVYWIHNAIEKIGGLACDESFLQHILHAVRESEKEDWDEAERVSEKRN